jgi:hypothetical protein
MKLPTIGQRNDPGPDAPATAPKLWNPSTITLPVPLETKNNKIVISR